MKAAERIQHVVSQIVALGEFSVCKERVTLGAHKLFALTIFTMFVFDVVYYCLFSIEQCVATMPLFSKSELIKVTRFHV